MGVVVLKELIFNSFYFGWVRWYWKKAVIGVGDSSSGLWGVACWWLLPRVPRGVSVRPGGVQAVQALIPRQAAELVTPPPVCKSSPVSGLPAGDSSSGFWGYQNETFNQLLTDFWSINHLTVYRAYIVHQNKPVHEFSKESKNIHRFPIYDLYCTHIYMKY